MLTGYLLLGVNIAWTITLYRFRRVLRKHQKVLDERQHVLDHWGANLDKLQHALDEWATNLQGVSDFTRPPNERRFDA